MDKILNGYYKIEWAKLYDKFLGYSDTIYNKYSEIKAMYYLTCNIKFREYMEGTTIKDFMDAVVKASPVYYKYIDKTKYMHVLYPNDSQYSKTDIIKELEKNDIMIGNILYNIYFYMFIIAEFGYADIKEYVYRNGNNINTLKDAFDKYMVIFDCVNKEKEKFYGYKKNLIGWNCVDLFDEYIKGEVLVIHSVIVNADMNLIDNDNIFKQYSISENIDGSIKIDYIENYIDIQNMNNFIDYWSEC